MKHTTVEGTQVDMTEQLGKEFGKFYGNPSALNWQRMTLAMIGYQQAKLGYNDSAAFLHDLDKLSPDQIERFWELHIVDHKAR